MAAFSHKGIRGLVVGNDAVGVSNFISALINTGYGNADGLSLACYNEDGHLGGGDYQTKQAIESEVSRRQSIRSRWQADRRPYRHKFLAPIECDERGNPATTLSTAF